MFWADKIAKEVVARFGAQGPVLIRDEKTLSGRVHVGSMRGVAVHGLLHEILDTQGTANTFKFELNDFDPMDGFPVYLPEEFRQYMGMSLKDVPSPDPSARNFAEYFANDFKSAIEHAGFTPEYYWASELYASGAMDGVIREALTGADAIRTIYKEISGSTKKEGWLPLSVICPQCKKIATTVATNFDGDTVQVNCYKTAVDYAEGCGFEGRVSPFGGKAKLPWKVEWPAKWKVVGVMVEGAGKDHSTRGGSRDVANHIAREVFHYEPPFDIPYEFLLVGGEKMASSKGRGSSAREIADLLPSKMYRLALLGKEYNQQFNFDPEGDTIPVLYDQYDKLAEQYQTIKDDDYARLFECIHPAGVATPQGPLPRFSQVAFVVQMPHMDIYKEFADADRAELDERAVYARKWLAQYAPSKFVFKLQDTMPAVELTAAQKETMAALAGLVEGGASAEDIHTKLHETKEFKTIYKLFLDKDSGPKAGWFLASLPREFVVARLREASQ